MGVLRRTEMSEAEIIAVQKEMIDQLKAEVSLWQNRWKDERRAHEDTLRRCRTVPVPIVGKVG